MKICYDVSKIVLGEGKDARKLDKIWKGKIELNMPRYTTRMSYIRNCNFQVNDQGEANVNNEMMDSVVKMGEYLEKHIGKVDVEHIPSGTKIVKAEELQFYTEAQDLLSWLSGKMLQGVKLGEN